MASAENFLDSLPVSSDQRTKLSVIGADSPFALLGTILAAQNDFYQYFGEEPARKLIGHLEVRLTDDQKAALKSPIARFPTGAIVNHPAGYRPPAMDLDRRESLLQQIERLRNEPDGDKRFKREIMDLERQIAALY